ncbi:MAG: biotin--[acetyl-CoA-carboxylase] ligase [Acidobacteria bacterium]|nr:biotin--[acetyl-CoA-carboxylase] ligase [Acidobacteriota bacterium]
MSAQAQDRQLDRLVDLLVENATVVVSGAKIASELGVPHSTLGEWMERLRELGVDVRGFPGSGYQLVRLPDIPTPHAIRNQLAGSRFGARVHHFYTMDSTMNEAGRLAAKRAPEGTLVLAEEQTAGRGRFGRHWHSETAAGLYFTLVLRPPIQPAAAPVLTLLSGVSVAEAIQEASQLAVDLRWPNDALINEKKCAGILVEMTAEPLRVSHVLVGIGINVNHRRIPGELNSEATSLSMEAGRAFSRLELLILVLKRLEYYYNLFLEQGAAGIVERFEEISSYARGKPVRVTDGAKVLTGVTEGLTPEGILLVRRQDGQLEKVLAGQVRGA